MPQEPYEKGPWNAPPAPATHVIVRPAYGGAAYEGSALVDTGSSCCAVPQKFADRSGWHWNGRWLISTPTGTRPMLVYTVVIDAFSRQWKVDVVGSERPYAIIGRNLLNNLKILLDGPALKMDVLG